MRNLYTLKANMTITFYTVDGQYPVVSRSVPNQVTPGSHQAFYNGLLSFQTKNDTSEDIPTATIVLTDDYDWSSILVPNDYVVITAGYRGDMPYSDKNTTVNSTLYCGLVTDIAKTGSYGDNSANRTFTITVQGMAKVLQSMNLSTFTELTSNLNGYQMLPDDATTGIAYSGKSSAVLIDEVLKKFVLNNNEYTKYVFQDENGQQFSLESLLQTQLQPNTDEAFFNSSNNQFMNYNGTILQMIKDMAVRPFNELYWTHEQGVATLHYRPTPFEQSEWTALEEIDLSSDNVISEETRVNDSEQSSIFKMLASDDSGSQLTSDGFSGSIYPLTNRSLIKRYGYKTMEVETPYFNGQANSDDASYGGTSEAGKGKTESEAQLHYPSYGNIQDYFALARGVKGTDDYDVPPEHGGNHTYDALLSSLKGGASQSSFVSQATATGYVSGTQANNLYAKYKSSNSQTMTKQDYLSIVAPNYNPTSTNASYSSTYLKSLSKMKDDPKKAAMELMQESKYTLGSKQAYDLVQAAIAGKGDVSKATYQKILGEGYNAKQDGVDILSANSDGNQDAISMLFQLYTQKLFNWYADNSKFHSGTITVQGTLGIENGKRLVVYDNKEKVYWEYYIESVGHNFSYTQGWTTQIGVTRGLALPNQGDVIRRFGMPYSYWGTYETFVGGYFGEQTMAAAIEAADSAGGGSDDTSGGSVSGGGDDKFSSGGKTATKAVELASGLSKKAGAGSYNQSYHTQDPFNMSSPKGDCSSLVYFAYKHAGVDLSTGGWTTWKLAKSDKLKTIGSSGSNKDDVYKKMHVGDLIFFKTTAKDDSHVGLVMSDGIIAWNTKKGVSTFSLKSNSYWWGSWRGHCMRLKE